MHIHPYGITRVVISSSERASSHIQVPANEAVGPIWNKNKGRCASGSTLQM
jgi:hypothetical protein